MRQLLVAIVSLCALASGTFAHAMESVPRAEYHERRVALASKLNGGVAIVFAATAPTDELTLFRQDSDFFYLTGWTEPGAALVVIAAGPATTAPRTGEAIPAHAYREVLLLPSRNRVMELYTGETMDGTTPGAAARAGVEEVQPMTALPAIVGDFLAADRRRTRTVWSQTDMPETEPVLSFLATTLGLPPEAARAQDVRALTRTLRTTKSPAEIELLRKAADASIAGQRAGMRAIHPGVLEQAVAGVELGTFMAQGCERWSYPPIVGSGQNSTVLHYSANDHTMAAGGLVVIDAACERSMYASDITRTMPVDGHFTARQKEIYDVVLGAQRAVAAAFVAGKFRLGNVSQRGPEVSDTLDKIAYDYINTHGKGPHGEPLGRYFLHGLGHSVGIDVHDPMDPQTRLDKGMVFTIEPGVYIPEEGIGVRIEDVVYVDSDGRLVDLIATLPHETNDVENAMRH